MGKRKIDKSKKIENKNQRSVAFCKRKRGFLKKAIELSRLCDQKIFMVMYDPDKDRVIHYSSEPSFSFSGAWVLIASLSASAMNLVLAASRTALFSAAAVMEVSTTA